MPLETTSALSYREDLVQSGLVIKTEELEGASKQVRIEVTTKGKTAYEVKQDDISLYIDFKR